MARRLIFALAAASSPAWAGGLLVGEQGSQPQERAGAFVAKADDPTALGLNPAGIAKATHRFEVYLGGNLLDYDETFARAGDYPMQADQTPMPSYTGTPFPSVKNQTGAQPIPTISFVEHIWKGLSIAEGVFAPQSYPGRDFPCAVQQNCQIDAQSGAPAPQRYDVLSQSAVIALPSLAVGYHIGKWVDVGVRASWGLGSLSARSFAWGVKNSEENPNNDSDVTLKVSDGFIPAFGAGVLVRPSDHLEIGVAYSSKVEMNGKGTASALLGSALSFGGAQDQIDPVTGAQASCDPNGTVGALKACVDLAMPQSVQGGVRWIFRDGWGGEKGDVELDGKWENWSKASDIHVIVDGRDHLTGFYLNPVTIRHGFQDTVSVRLGGSYQVKDVSIRAGLAYDTAAAPTSWTRADMDGKSRFLGSIGFAVAVAKHYVIDAGFAYVNEPTVTVTNVTIANPDVVANRVQPDAVQPLRRANQQDYAPINAGTYTSGYLIGSVGVTARF